MAEATIITDENRYQPKKSGIHLHCICGWGWQHQRSTHGFYPPHQEVGKYLAVCVSDNSGWIHKSFGSARASLWWIPSAATSHKVRSHTWWPPKLSKLWKKLFNQDSGMLSSYDQRTWLTTTQTRSQGNTCIFEISLIAYRYLPQPIVITGIMHWISCCSGHISCSVAKLHHPHTWSDHEWEFHQQRNIHWCLAVLSHCCLSSLWGSTCPSRIVTWTIWDKLCGAVLISDGAVDG